MNSYELGHEDRVCAHHLGRILRENGYNETNLLQRTPHAWDPAGLEAPYLLEQVLDTSQPLDALIAFFAHQGSLSCDQATAALGSEILGWMLARGLAAEDPPADRIIPLVDISCFGETRFMTDPGRIGAAHQPDWYGKRVPDKDRVMYVGNDSILLARATSREPRNRVLDLCTGCGIHAILASRHSDQVVGVDINPRALFFARFNAALNECENVRFHEGDLYEPLGDGQFDLILANPPFVATPQVEIKFRDGGESGEDVLASIIAGLHRHLEPGGSCRIVTDLMFQGGRSYEEKIRRWLGERNDGFNILLILESLRTPFRYALDHQRYDVPGQAPKQRAAGFTARMELYNRMESDAFSLGLIMLEEGLENRAGWYREKWLIGTGGDLPDTINRVLKRVDRFSGNDGMETMLELTPVLREGVMLNHLELLQPDGKSRHGGVMVTPPQACFSEKNNRITEEGLRLLRCCDGKRSVSQILAALYGAESKRGTAQRFSAMNEIQRYYELDLIDLD